MSGHREIHRQLECVDESSRDPFERVVGAESYASGCRERRSRSASRGRRARLDRPRCSSGRPAELDDRAGLAVGRVAVLLGMDGFEHVAHLANLGGRHMAEDVPIKMNHAALPPSVWQILRGAFYRPAGAGIGAGALHSVEAAIDSGALTMRNSQTCPPWRLRRCQNLRKPSELTALATSSETLRTSPAQVRFLRWRRDKGTDAHPRCGGLNQPGSGVRIFSLRLDTVLDVRRHPQSFGDVSTRRTGCPPDSISIGTSSRRGLAEAVPVDDRRLKGLAAQLWNLKFHFASAGRCSVRSSLHARVSIRAWLGS